MVLAPAGSGQCLDDNEPRTLGVFSSLIISSSNLMSGWALNSCVFGVNKVISQLSRLAPLLSRKALTSLSEMTWLSRGMFIISDKKARELELES